MTRRRPGSQEIGQYRYWLGYCAWKMGDGVEAEKQLRVSRDLLGVSADLDGEAAVSAGPVA